MDTIKIEKLQKSVGKLSLGGSPFGACYGDDVKIDECRAVIKQAFDAKVNYIDTAPWYGQGKCCNLEQQPKSTFKFGIVKKLTEF